MLRGLIALILAVPLGWLVYRQVRRGQAAELLATNLEFRMSQRYWIFGPHRAISRANIVDLEYRPERGGGDAGSDPSGLYANLKFNASVCLLPYLDEPGTNAAIEAIYRHFPDMPIAYDKRGLGEHFIRLGL